MPRVQIEEPTKRFWAVLLVVMLFMCVNFYLYISPHICGGYNIDCNHITWPNGTITPVPKGQFAAESKDIKPVLFFDIMVGIPTFVIVAWSVLKGLRDKTRPQ